MGTPNWQTEDFVNLFRYIETLKSTVSFEQHLALSPEASTVFNTSTEDDGIHISTNLLSLWGIYGPLPDSYNELFLEQERLENYALHDFLNIFHHRLMQSAQMLYQQTEPRLLIESIKSFSPISLISLDLNHWFFKKTRTSDGLITILEKTFETHIEIEPLTGGWVYAHENAWSKLGVQYTTLGVNTLLGQKYFSPASACDVILGSMSFSKFLQIWLYRLDELKDLCFAYLPFMTDVRLFFKVKAHYIEDSTLDGNQYLGMNSWLLSAPRTVEAYTVKL